MKQVFCVQFLTKLGCIILIVIVTGCASNQISVPPSPYPISYDAFVLDTIAEGFAIPYGLAILGEQEFYVTDRVGKMIHFIKGESTEIKGLPEVATFGTPGLPAIMHGGLMELSLHPNYSYNDLIYVCYLSLDGYATVARFKVRDTEATDFEIVFKARNVDYTGNGMRMVWEDSTHFFLNIGNSNFSTSTKPILFAQDLNHDAGKIHRLKDNGSIPADNPILIGQNMPTTIWSYGHRDVQGLSLDTATGILYGIEHGPKGGDEFNIIKKGGNYGWPLVSYGINYDGAWVSMISQDSAEKITVLPQHYWTVPTDDGGQALAPACLLYAEESTVEDWNGFFLFGSLAFRRLMKFDFVTGKTFGLPIEGRVRTLQQLPSGDILALIERNDLRKSNGMIVRISSTD